MAGVAFEEREAQHLLQLPDRVADRARREVQDGRRRPERPRTAGSLENPEEGQRHILCH
jgi:hypothetical protein